MESTPRTLHRMADLAAAIQSTAKNFYGFRFEERPEASTVASWRGSVYCRSGD